MTIQASSLRESISCADDGAPLAKLIDDLPASARCGQSWLTSAMYRFTLAFGLLRGARQRSDIDGRAVEAEVCALYAPARAQLTALTTPIASPSATPTTAPTPSPILHGVSQPDPVIAAGQSAVQAKRRNNPPSAKESLIRVPPKSSAATVAPIIEAASPTPPPELGVMAPAQTHDVVGLERASNTAYAADITSPSDTIKAAVMRATPEVFKFERVTSGLSAVLYEAVRQWGLYKLEGFDSMTAYAEARLGVIGKPNNAAYARAGKAVWENYPALAQSAVDSLVGPKGFTRVNPSLMPSVPGVGLLRELPAAIDRTEPAHRAELLERVGSGQMTHLELRHYGRATKPANPTKSPKTGTVTNVTAAEPRVPKGFKRPDIFNDLGDLVHAACALREATSTLDSLRAGWSEHADHEVEPILPTLKEIIVALKAAATKLEKTTPRTICTACRGEGERCRPCRSTGWLPAKPSAPLHKTRPQTKKPAVTATKKKKLGGRSS